MRRKSVFAAVLATPALLAGCGSDDSSSPATSAPASSSSATTSSAAPSSSGSAVKSVASSTAPTAGAAPAGSAIKAGATSRYPTAVGDYSRQGETGPATIYSSDGNLISLSFLSGSNYDLIVENVTQQRTNAGTGVCGATSSPTNLTCYLRADDGVINVSADAGDVPLPNLVTFTNELTAALGTS